MARIQPAPPSGRRRKTPKAPKPARSGTPIRNSLLLLIFAALLALIVIIMPKEPTQSGVTVLAPNGTIAEEGAIITAPTLRISEVISSNRRAYPDDTGNYPDLVEIENYGKEPVNLAGIGLSDRNDRVLFLFPDIQLGGGERVIVFCDDTNVSDPNAALHARFKISSLGEELYLYNQAAQAFDTVKVPALNSDMSYALTDKGWIITEQYTPGYENTADGYEAMRTMAAVSSEGLVLNEVVASNKTTLQDEDGEYSDWIELYNGGTLPIHLYNYALSDDETNPIKWRFPQGVVIQPGEHYVVFASGKNRPGGDGKLPHTNFRLAAEGETVILSDILGQPIDRVTYDNLGDDESYGRVTGLEHTWQVYKQPTPQLPNNRQSEIEMDNRMRARNTSGVFIAEVVSSSTGVETAYGNTSYDIIKLVNRNNETFDLSGWGLSDSVGHPRKWQFPGGAEIAPGDFLLVFASGLGKSPVNSGALHSTFRLSALGETVVLSDPQGNIYDKLVVPKLETDNSYGRDFDQGGLFYYDKPEGMFAYNLLKGFAGYAQSPTIETKGGIYARSVTVTVSAPEGVKIRYTTDGTPPSDTVGEDYVGPVEISGKVTAFRARGFVEGLKPSEIVTETYLMNTYHSLPVISITMDPDDLWNEETGIYADGTEDDFLVTPFDKATYWKVKANEAIRERAANFEYFTPDGDQILNQNVGVQLNGQFSLDLAQKSFRITARAKYGVPTLKYSFFDNRPYSEYNAVILRNGGNMGVYDRIADALISNMVDWTDAEIMHMAQTPVICYLNGEYWGQYYLAERINKYSIAAYEGWSDPEAIDFIKGEDNVISGMYTNYEELIKFVKAHDLKSDPEALQKVLDWIDVDNYFDFMIFEMYTANTDAGNIKFYRQRVEGAKWRWVLFDLDWGYYDRTKNGCFIWLDPKGAGNKNFENILIRKLLEVPELQDKFLTRYGELFQAYFADTDRILALVDEMVAEIDLEMPMHQNRWAGETKQTAALDPYLYRNNAYNYWKSRVNRLKNIICGRPNYAWNETKEWFKLTDEQMIGYFGPMPEKTEDKF